MLHNGEPVMIETAKPSIALSYATAYSRAPSYGQIPTVNNENMPTTTSDPTAPTRLPKSRTMNVLSSISQSFSRSSITSISRNRDASGSSASSGTAAGASGMSGFRSSRSSLSRANGHPGDFARASQLQKPTPGLANPRLITTAQPSAYWSGRFAALHDRFHSELLSPQNLHTIIEAHAVQSSFSEPGILSNPPAKIYGPCRTQPAYEPNIGAPSANGPGRIPFSSTGSAVLQMSRSTSIANVTQAPEQASASAAIGSPVPRLDVETYKRILAFKASGLVDDDHRCKRVFAHLESLCVTDEARRSLHGWQQEYARCNRRPVLLPRGGTMEDTRGFVSRLFGARKSGISDWQSDANKEEVLETSSGEKRKGVARLSMF